MSALSLVASVSPTAKTEDAAPFVDVDVVAVHVANVATIATSSGISRVNAPLATRVPPATGSHL